MARVDLNGWVVYRGLALVGRCEGAEETGPFNLIFFFQFSFISRGSGGNSRYEY